MLRHQARFVRATYLIFRGERQRALVAIDEALEAGPPARLRVALRGLEARTWSRLGKARRMLEAVEDGLEAAQRAELVRGWGARHLLTLFDELSAGQPASPHQVTLEGLRLSGSGSGKQLVLVGLGSQLAESLIQAPVRLFVAGHAITEVWFSILPAPAGEPLRAHFQVRLRRAIVAELYEQAELELELAGARHPLPWSVFGRAESTSDGVPAQAVPTTPGALEKVKSGYILDSTGALTLPKNADRAWLGSTFELYERARKWLKREFGYDLYLTGGTLLGYARAGEIISFDKDFDTGYVSKHTNPEDIRREFKAIILGLLRQGENVRVLTTAQRPQVRRDYFWFGTGAHRIDVFVGAFIDGKYRRPTFVDTQLTPEDFFPFEVKKLSGFEVVVPRHPEKKVAAIYGPGWRTPDPFWKKVKSAEILAYRQTIMLTDEDLLEIAEVSLEEGPLLKQLLASGQLETAS